MRLIKFYIILLKNVDNYIINLFKMKKTIKLSDTKANYTGHSKYDTYLEYK